MGAEDILEEDARADWIQRGFALKDFSMKKMTKIWDDEEREEIAHEKKKKIIGHKHVPITEKASKVLAKVQANIAESSSSVLGSLTSYEPVILRNRRWLREHVALIHQMDEECTRYKTLKLSSHTSYRKTAKEIEEKEEDRRQRIEHKDPLLRRLKEMKTEADRKDREFENEQLEIKWKYWRDLQMQEKEEYENQVETMNTTHLAYKRSMNMKYWKAKILQNRKASAQATESLNQKRQSEAQGKIEHVLEEMAQDENEQMQWDNLGLDRTITKNGLGLFGIPVEPGDYESLENGGFQAELDEHTIAFPTAGPFDMTHEETRVALMDATSVLQQAQEKQYTLNHDYDLLQRDQSTLIEKEQECINLIDQIKHDHNELLETLGGPPRREPGDIERKQIQTWMELKASIETRLGDIQARIRLSGTQLSRMHDSLEALKHEITAYQVKADALQAKVDEYDHQANDLPMIIGRSIGQISKSTKVVNDQNGYVKSEDLSPMLPHDLLTRISHRTQFELIKAAAIPAFQVYEEARVLGLESWKISKQKMLEENEFEATLHRLAKIKDRLIQQQTLNQRSDVVNAIEKFHSKQYQLYKVKKITNGPIDWWRSRDYINSLGVSNNELMVVLDEPLRKGILRGSISLPGHCLWQIHFKIVIRPQLDQRLVTMEDKVKVHFGTTSNSQSQVGIYHVLGDHGQLNTEHDVMIEYVGARLYYAFEICKSALSPKYTISLLSSGSFVEDESAEANREYMYSQKHILSEYVKMLRIQSHQGNHRIAILLEELIDVEASTEEYWDSNILHGHFQRFLRVHYAAQLREEIQEQISKTMERDIKKRKQAYFQLLNSHPEALFNTRQDKCPISNHEARLESSMLEYRHRKSEYIEVMSTAARKLLGCPLEVFIESIWCRGIILNMRIEWKEGGTKLSFLHQVQLDSQNSSPVSLWLDLSMVKHVFIANTMDVVMAHTRAIEIREDTKSLIELEREYLVIMNQEDLAFEDAKVRDLLRREKDVHQEATRVCHYDPQVKSLLESEAKRLCQRSNQSIETALTLLQQNYIKETVHARMQFIHKTWDRKNKRRLEKRREERKSRKLKYEQSYKAKLEIFAKELDTEEEKAKATRQSQIEQDNALRELKAALQIPNFNQAIAKAPECSHFNVKAWGGFYGQGLKCKSCGAEVSKLYESKDAARGTDPALDKDIEKHRENEASFRFTSAAHLKAVEDERLRLEKERREIDLSEIRMYDAVHSKAIAEFNFRHGIDRANKALEATRNHQDRHLAAYRDEISFYARINQFRYRLELILKLRSDLYQDRLLQIEMLSSLHADREITDETIAIVQQEQERARELLKLRREAIEQYKITTEYLKACLIEKKLAFQVRQGVEQDAKFAMSHAIALERTSTNMRCICNKMNDERIAIKEAVRSAKEACDEAIKKRKTLEDPLLALFYRQRGTKVFTKYGVGHVLYYRQEDGFLSIKLQAWKATVFQSLWLLVHEDKAKQERESIHMATTEAETRAFLSFEQDKEAKELLLMQDEDIMCETIIKWANLSAKHNLLQDEAITICELQTQVHLARKSVRLQLATAAKEEAKKAHICRLKIIKSVSQPLGIRKQKKTLFKLSKSTAQVNEAEPSIPPPPKLTKQSKFDHARLTRACLKRMIMDKVEQDIIATKKTLDAKFEDERLELLRVQVCQKYTQDFVHDFLQEIALDGVNEGEASTRELEDACNIVYSIPYPRLQVHIYHNLLRQGQVHTQQLQVMQRSWLRQLKRLGLIQAEVDKRKAVAAAIEAEKKRIEMLCKEMAREELLCRRFYRDQKRLMMIEMRSMQIAENEMREYMRQYELQLMLAQFNNLDQNESSQQTSKEARRLEIKQNKREIKRLAIEWALIKKEDELAMMLREVLLKEERDARYEQQQLEFMLEQAVFQESDNEDEDNEFVSGDFNPNDELHHEPQNILSTDNNAVVDIRQVKKREKQRELQRLTAIKKAEFMHQLNEEYMMAAAKTLENVAASELLIITTKNELHFLQKLALDLQHVPEMQADLKRCLKQCKQVMDAALEKKLYAEKCIARCQAAEEALEKAIIKEKSDNLYMIKTVRETTYMDSAVLHKRTQRFHTDYLSGEKYFELLVQLIQERALTVATERHLFYLTQEIEKLDQESTAKSQKVKMLWRKHTRTTRLWLLRSELGHRFFRKERHHALQRAFQGWARVWTHAIIVRKAFDLRYSLLRQEHQLNEFETITKPHPVASPRETQLRKFQHRWIVCRLCKQRYSEAQNTKFSCIYHPGIYEVACVKTCGTRKGGTIQSNCMLHRAKRWVCCDDTNEGTFGSTGCKRRFHLPTRDDPIIQNMIAIAQDQENNKLNVITKKLVQLQDENVSGKVYSKFRDQLESIENTLIFQRDKMTELSSYKQR
ncbi:hypothetical protein THRCLA_11316 [Thraustotheca clavata]|uniref:Uncharacterized protein n=1 Tax=Thraustotheca clavata TaxID=74557 RepID=A0A1V9Y827_9STRA|nr:hypothetical protein THRCLA_11316 [Thraustotheca clavata]